MQASLTRSLGVAGLLAISLTGCQSSSLGKLSWNPKNWKFGRKPDTALAANNTAAEAASPWQPQLPSNQAAAGYGAQTPNSYAGTQPYGPGGYTGVPTNYTADPSQSPWAAAPATGAAPTQSYEQVSYGPPAAPQTGYYQAPQNAYAQQPAQQPYGAPMTQAAPPVDPYNPGAQYGGAPTYPQQNAAPAYQTADSGRYPTNTQYDGTSTQPYGAAQTGYGAAPTDYAAPPATTGYENTMPAAQPQQEMWPPAQGSAQPSTQQYPQYQSQPAAAPGAQQPYRPGGTSDYSPTTGSPVTPASYESQPAPAATGYAPQ